MQPNSITLVDVSVSHGADEVFSHVSLTVGAGSRIGVVGPNGVGKTTLLRSLLPEDSREQLKLDAAAVKWAEKARLGYWPQDPSAEFAFDETLTEWMTRSDLSSVIKERVVQQGFSAE